MLPRCRMHHRRTGCQMLPRCRMYRCRIGCQMLPLSGRRCNGILHRRCRRRFLRNGNVRLQHGRHNLPNSHSRRRRFRLRHFPFLRRGQFRTKPGFPFRQWKRFRLKSGFPFRQWKRFRLEPGFPFRQWKRFRLEPGFPMSFRPCQRRRLQRPQLQLPLRPVSLPRIRRVSARVQGGGAPVRPCVRPETGASFR